MAYVVSTSHCDGRGLDTHRQLACLAARADVRQKIDVHHVCAGSHVPEQGSLSEEAIRGIRGQARTLNSESGGSTSGRGIQINKNKNK